MVGDRRSPSEVDDLSMDAAEEKINTGIGIVVPAEQIISSFAPILGGDTRDGNG